MLYLVKGRAASGKTRFLRNEILKKINNSESRPLLIIPEQFSFETEKAMLKELGAKALKNIDIYSFSRLAFNHLKNTEAFSKAIPDGGIRAALMSEALVALEGRLNIFSSCKTNATALDALVDFCKELKYCCIDSEELQEKTNLLDECYLKEKLNEINLINETYGALISQSFFDDTDAVHLLSEYASENNVFKNRTVFIDGFRTFTKQELECFYVMLQQADNVYITLCADEVYKVNSPFGYIKAFENKLCAVAAERNIVVERIFLEQAPNAFPKDIYALEKNLFSNVSENATESDESIEVAECLDSDDEVRFVSSTIKKLLRSGKYRCRDIAVIERTNGSYKNKLIAALERLDIPVFDDSRRSLSFETLFVYLNSVLSCVSAGFTTENLFSYLKTGLASLSLSDISRLEKYALVWGINGKAWLNDFTMHPDGFGNDFDEKAKLRLEELNNIRKNAVLPLAKLKKACEDKDGKGISECIYNFLIDENIPDRLFDLCTALEEDGFPVEAKRQSVSWDVLMNLLDIMATIGENKYFGLNRWFDLFTILVDSGDVGEIPQGLDEVKIGSADRIRTEQMKVVFLVGVNKDEFPLVSIKNGILTDADRVSLTNLGLEIRPPFEDTVDEESFIAYCAVTAANEKLFLTYKKVNDEGADVAPSEIITTALDCISNLKVTVTSECDPLDFVESEDGAFALLARIYNDNTPLTATLLEYFADRKEYEGKLSALARANGNLPVKFSDKRISEKLFGEKLYLSASRVESFYNCPFSYFMRYGLKAEPLRVAELDPAQSGTIVHLVMETVLKEYPGQSFIDADYESLKATVSGVLTSYLNEKMGGVEEKSKRFMFLFDRLVDISMAIIDRLRSEFGVGSFAPCDFELKIGGEQVPAYNLPLETGEVTVTGSIDRVDIMEKDGIKYLRVVDYKTGKKEFKPSELFDGLNIQMVLYLMALEKNGQGYYGETVPAGVLYLPSRIGVSNYLDNRSPSVESIAAQKRVSGKLSGMVLDSPVVFNGMGVDKISDYLPVSYKKDGSPKGNYYSLSNFKTLSKIIDQKIIDMGNALHNGDVSAVPCGSDGEGKMCEYCSYKPVCGHEFGDEIYELTGLTHLKALERLEDECDE